MGFGVKNLHVSLIKIGQNVYNYQKCLTILNSTASEFREPCETGASFFEERVFLRCGKEGIGPDYCDSVALRFLRVQLKPGLVPVTCLGDHIGPATTPLAPSQYGTGEHWRNCCVFLQLLVANPETTLVECEATG